MAEMVRPGYGTHLLTPVQGARLGAPDTIPGFPVRPPEGQRHVGSDEVGEPERMKDGRAKCVLSAMLEVLAPRGGGAMVEASPGGPNASASGSTLPGVSGVNWISRRAGTWGGMVGLLGSIQLSQSQLGGLAREGQASRGGGKNTREKVELEMADMTKVREPYCRRASPITL